MELNTPTLWGIDRTYFETTFSGRTMDKFRLQSSIIKRNNIGSLSDDEKEIEMDRLFNAVASNVIQAIVASPMGAILRRTKFDWYEDHTKITLREGVCEAVQNLILNKNAYERTNGSSIQSNSFTINSDTPAWLLASDTFGIFTKNLISNAKLNLFEVVDDADIELFMRTTNGNYQVLGYFDDELIEELT